MELARSIQSDNGLTPLERTLDALFQSKKALQNATSNNKGGYREKAIAEVGMAIHDIEAAIAFLADHSSEAGAPPSLEIKPDFAVSRAANHKNMQRALNALRVASDELARSPGGGLGGYRREASVHIAAAVASIVSGIRVANALLDVPAVP